VSRKTETYAKTQQKTIMQQIQLFIPVIQMTATI